MPTATNRQRSTSRSSSKRPESPIKRSSSARQHHSARSPSPFSPNTSHNEMPATLLLDPESTAILKPSQPTRRRSTRLSAATAKVSSVVPNGAAKTTSLKSSNSMNGHGIKASDSINELDELTTKDVIAESPAVPNGHGPTTHANTFINALEQSGVNGTAILAPPKAGGVSESPRASSLPAAKPKIDWEIPRKALHSSIGVVVLGLYAFSFTIPPLVSLLCGLLAAISLLDAIRLNNPRFEQLYEKVCGPLMRESEKHKVNGTVWYLIGVIFVLTFYPADIAVVSILILSWADTAASTIGRLWGRYTPPLPRRIPYIGLKFAPRKSTAGYVAAWVMGGIITAAFLGNHASGTAGLTFTQSSSPSPSWSELTASNWGEVWAWMKSCTNFNDAPVAQIASSWKWEQRVGGGWPGLLVLGLWSGFVTAVSEAMDLEETDDNLTLPILSGLGIWAYIGLLRWIDQRPTLDIEESILTLTNDIRSFDPSLLSCLSQQPCQQQKAFCVIFLGSGMLYYLRNVQSPWSVSTNLIQSLTRAGHRAMWQRANSTVVKRPLNELHYHLMKAPSGLQHWSKSVFAVSYLPDPPIALEGSKTILGTIPALEEGEGPGLNDFQENSQFIELMHDTVRAALAEGIDENIQAEATQRGSGWLHIQDERNVPALGRIGDPDDIVGSVRVEDGKILAETYQRMPSYRLFTSDGPPKLSAGLAKKLEEALLEQQKAESTA